MTAPAASGRWQAWVIESGDVVVVPIFDLICHDIDGGDTCVCGPAVEPVPRRDGSIGWMYTHHSLDGRERSEQTRGNR